TAATATGSRPTETDPRWCKPSSTTRKTSSRLSGVLAAYNVLPLGESASGRTEPDSNRVYEWRLTLFPAGGEAAAGTMNFDATIMGTITVTVPATTFHFQVIRRNLSIVSPYCGGFLSSPPPKRPPKNLPTPEKALPAPFPASTTPSSTTSERRKSWRGQKEFGAVPAMKASSNVFSQEGFARSRLSASMRTNSIPDGFEKYILSGSGGGCSCVALIMNSVQMGNAERAPSRLRSRLSSYPTQAMARKSFV